MNSVIKSTLCVAMLAGCGQTVPRPVGECPSYDRLGFGNDYIGVLRKPLGGVPLRGSYQSMEDCIQRSAALNAGLYGSAKENALMVPGGCNAEISLYIQPIYMHSKESWVDLWDRQATLIAHEAEIIIKKRREVCKSP
jgi:hypothetical protein